MLPLCGVMLFAWSVQEVRAESSTNIEAQIRLSQRLNIMAEDSAPDIFRAGGIKLASSVEPRPDTAHGFVFKAAVNDLTELGRRATTQEFWRTMLLIGGISLVSSVADNPLDKFAVNHGKSGIMPGVKTVGNNLPLLAFGYSATMLLTSDVDSKMAKTSYSSLAAGGVGFAGALGLKYIVGRARPNLEQGKASFNPFSTGNGDTSWPSIHTTVMWAAITPYAKAYDAPWLYGVAAVTNAARVAGRDHWLSDTVAGSLLGYAIGDFMWESHQDKKEGAHLAISPNMIAVYWNIE